MATVKLVRSARQKEEDAAERLRFDELKKMKPGLVRKEDEKAKRTVKKVKTVIGKENIDPAGAERQG